MIKQHVLQEHHDMLQLLLLIGLGMILISLLASGVGFWLLFLLGLVVSVAAIYYRNKYYKCPHCSTKLNPLLKLPEFCPECGKDLTASNEVSK